MKLFFENILYMTVISSLLFVLALSSNILKSSLSIVSLYYFNVLFKVILSATTVLLLYKCLAPNTSLEYFIELAFISLVEDGSKVELSELVRGLD